MGFYGRHVLPRLLDLTMRAPMVRRERQRLLPLAAGDVLEVGIGSGLNLLHYSTGVSRLWGVDSSPELLRLAGRRAARMPFPVELIEQSAERLPFEDERFDTVVTTFTLCSIPDVRGALGEMRRVLRPGGRLVFIEHGRAPDPRVTAWQDRLTPVWKRIGGGCHLNREMDGLITRAGFTIERLEMGYGQGLKPFAYLYRGLASPWSPSS
jgi:ubiquinone/menaquinone biosynthesis C-methylase UbiE